MRRHRVLAPKASGHLLRSSLTVKAALDRTARESACQVGPLLDIPVMGVLTPLLPTLPTPLLPTFPTPLLFAAPLLATPLLLAPPLLVPPLLEPPPLLELGPADGPPAEIPPISTTQFAVPPSLATVAPPSFAIPLHSGGWPGSSIESEQAPVPATATALTRAIERRVRMGSSGDGDALHAAFPDTR